MPTIRYCRHCGEYIGEGNGEGTFCPFCGKSVSIGAASGIPVRQEQAATQPAGVESERPEPVKPTAEKVSDNPVKGDDHSGSVIQSHAGGTKPETKAAVPFEMNPVREATIPEENRQISQDTSADNLETPKNENPEIIENTREEECQASEKMPDDSKNRLRKIMALLLAVGICIISLGLSGKIIMDKVSGKLMTTEFVQGFISPEFDAAINRKMRGHVLNLMISLIKNDSSGFVNGVKALTKATAALAEPNGFIESGIGYMIEAAAEESFYQTREMFVESAGNLMPMLLIMAYFRELLWIGVILTAGSLLLLYLLGTRKKHLKEIKARQLFIVVAVWVVIVAILTVVALVMIDREDEEPEVVNGTEVEFVTGEAVEEAAEEAGAAVEEAILQAGDIITFGTYPQTAEGTDQTPIEWLVLDVQDGKALVISRYGLDTKPYNTEWTDVTWETCSLRAWLNGEFLNQAFSPGEQSAILLTTVDNSKAQGYRGYSTSGGNNTPDRIFLLSYAEANKYFGVKYWEEEGAMDNMASRVAPTEYAIKAGAWTSSRYLTADGTEAGWWWLRSPGLYQSDAARVRYYGSLYYNDVHNGNGCARPAFWLDLEILNLISSDL